MGMRATVPKFAAVPPVPGAEPVVAPPRERSEELGSQRTPPDMAYPWETGRVGVRGKMLGMLRRIAWRVLQATTNLEGVLVQQQDYAREMVATTERDLAAVEQRLERSFDALKDNLDARIDRTSDWAGAQMAATSGTLEERQERALHLAHNMVVELTNARLDLQQVQARLNETARRMTELEMRGRTLEKLTLHSGD